MGLDSVLVHRVLVARKEVENVASLPSADERANDVADSIFISPLTPFALLVVLEGEVLPDDASQSSCWV